MSKPSVVIEQLFEDVHRGGMGTQELEKGGDDSIDIPGKDTHKAARNKKAVPKRNSKHSSDNPNQFDPSIHMTNSVNTMTTGSGTHSKGSDIPSVSGTSRGKYRRPSTGSVIENNLRYPISFDTALSLFSNKLSPLEQVEIQNYENIYFLGLTANKIKAGKGANSNIFDDEDGYYTVVPHDQIAYRYEALDKPFLGKGTFSQVIKIYDHKDKRKVALKIVRSERIYLKQSREELRILQVLRKADAEGTHNIVQFYEFFMFRNHMCITFELLGMNLYQILKKNQFKGLGSTKILSVARSTLNCLALLYKSRIIHCDIKPENIMLRRNGDYSSVTVGDFGSSCYEQQQIYNYVQSRFYRAPEVLIGMRYGPAIDMWSLGCVLGELSSGYPIFMGRDDSDQMAAIEEIMGQIPGDMRGRDGGRVRIKPSAGRGGPGSKDFSSVVFGDENFKDFIKQTLEWDPAIRPSPSQMQKHPWIKPRPSTSTARKVSSSSSHPAVTTTRNKKTGSQSQKTSSM